MIRRVERPETIEENFFLPYCYTRRGYRLSVLHALDTGKRLGVLVWHRLSGKDKTVNGGLGPVALQVAEFGFS